MFPGALEPTMGHALHAATQTGPKSILARGAGLATAKCRDVLEIAASGSTRLGVAGQQI